MARPKNFQNRALPQNLTYDKGIYRYRNPRTGKRTQLGKEKNKAISVTNEANARIMPASIKSVVEKIVTVEQSILEPEIYENFAAYIETRFKSHHSPSRRVSESVKAEYIRKCRHICKYIGHYQIKNVKVKQITQFLDNFKPTPGQANKYRSLLGIIFDYVIADGECESNPARAPLKLKTDKKRERLSFDQYKAIHAATPSWLQNCMDLALVTLQRRGDNVKMKFSDIKQETIAGQAVDFLYVIQ